MKHKKDIISTRIGGFGSSDANMVAAIGNTGFISDAHKERIAVMLGLKEQKQFSTMATDKGNEIEEQIYNAIITHYPNAISNPYYESEELSKQYGFKVFNHIDYEIETDEEIIWIENKATIDTFDETIEKYFYQLKWHWMLLCDKANKLHKPGRLLLSHYLTVGSEEFDPINLTIGRPKYVDISTFTDFFDGLTLISEVIKDFKYKPKDELFAEELPVELQNQLQIFVQMNNEYSSLKVQMDEFKDRLTKLMSESNIKSLAFGDNFKATLIPASKSSTIDTKRLAVDNPELIEKYTEVSNRKEYVKITTK